MVSGGTDTPEHIALGTNCSGVKGPGGHLHQGPIYFVTNPLILNKMYSSKLIYAEKRASHIADQGLSMGKQRNSHVIPPSLSVGKEFISHGPPILDGWY